MLSDFYCFVTKHVSDANLSRSYLIEFFYIFEMLPSLSTRKVSNIYRLTMLPAVIISTMNRLQ